MRTAMLALMGVVMFCESAQACSCAPPPPPPQALERAAAVFSGKVTKIEQVNDFSKRVTIALDRTWKGVEGAEVAVYTASNGAACGYGFKEGESYLIYTYKTDRGQETNICTRTRGIADAAEDIKALGEGKPAK